MPALSQGGATVRVVILLALFGAPAALAQTVYTYCDQVGQQTNCRTRLPRQQPLPALEVRSPDVIGPYRSLQENRRANEALRLEQERAAMEAELLREQIELLRAQRESLQRQQQAAQADEGRRLVRILSYHDRVAECVRKHAQLEPRRQCVDDLTRTDPEFALGRAEAGQMPWQEGAPLLDDRLRAPATEEQK